MAGVLSLWFCRGNKRTNWGCCSFCKFCSQIFQRQAGVSAFKHANSAPYYYWVHVPFLIYSMSCYNHSLYHSVWDTRRELFSRNSDKNIDNFDGSKAGSSLNLCDELSDYVAKANLMDTYYILSIWTDMTFIIRNRIKQRKNSWQDGVLVTNSLFLQILIMHTSFRPKIRSIWKWME